MTNVVAIAAGSEFSLALKRDGSVVAWGDNSAGQCGVPDGLTGVKAIAAGGQHSLALKGDGTIVVWGNGNSWMIPIGLTGVVAIAAGDVHNLALKADGTVMAWGNNYNGQCTVPTGLNEVKAIAAGQAHSLALKNDGTVVAWGGTVPRGLTNVVAIAAGKYHSLVLLKDGTVVPWGDNGGGQCTAPTGLDGVKAVAMGMYALALKGDGTLAAWGSEAFTPAGLNGVVAIAASPGYGLAVKEDGTVVAWGADYPQSSVRGLSAVKAIAAGQAHSLALKADGTVVAWGANDSGQSTVPSGLSGVVAIAAGTRHSLALKADGAMVAWGNGVGAKLPSGLQDVVAIAAGGVVESTGNIHDPDPIRDRGFSLAVKADGTVVAWGDNTFGQCLVPVGLTGVAAVAAGRNHSLALRRDGTVVSWGTLDQSTVPSGLTNVFAIAAGISQSLAVVDANPTNKPPSPARYPVATWRDRPYTLGVAELLRACGDPDGDTLSVTAVSATSTAAGTVVRSGSVITYTPPSGFIGTDTFTYTLTDSHQASAQGIIIVKVLVPAEYQITAFTDRPCAFGLADLFRACCDLDRDVFSVTVVSATSKAGSTVLLSTNGITYTPPAGFTGTDTFTYTVTDGDGTPAQGSVTVRIIAPVEGQLTSWPDQTRIFGVPELLRSCCDLDGWAFSVTAVSAASTAGGTVVLSGNFIIYTPRAGFTGTDTFTCAVTDAGGASTRTTVNVRIQPPPLGKLIAWGNPEASLPDAATFTQVATGRRHGLALKADGTVVAWGDNTYGQGNVPSALSNVVAIAAGGSHSLVLKADLTIAAWGDNQLGQTTIPSPLRDVVAISAGNYHNLALKSDGTVVAWGGINYLNEITVPGGLSNVVAVAAGWVHSLALKADGTVVGWGARNHDGQGAQATVPTGLSNVVAIAAGGFHSLALKRDGTVIAWGANNGGQTNVPPGLADVVAIAAGYDSEAGYGGHSLALKQDGTVVAWGSNSAGECNVPSGLSGVLAIAGGSQYSVALVEVDSTNHAPVAAQYAFATWRDRPNTLAFIDLLRASSDPDGDPLSVTAVSSASSARGTVVLSTNAITYTPPSGFTGTDAFTYTLTDPHQAAATGTVTVKVIAPDGDRPSSFGVTIDATTVTVRFLGSPGQDYQFEASTYLVDWVSLGQTTAAANGLFEFKDADKSLYPYRYYRARR